MQFKLQWVMTVLHQDIFVTITEIPLNFFPKSSHLIPFRAFAGAAVEEPFQTHSLRVPMDAAIQTHSHKALKIKPYDTKHPPSSLHLLQITLSPSVLGIRDNPSKGRSVFLSVKRLMHFSAFKYLQAPGMDAACLSAA